MLDNESILLDRALSIAFRLKNVQTNPKSKISENIIKEESDEEESALQKACSDETSANLL
jgi:hypothetical protein